MVVGADVCAAGDVGTDNTDVIPITERIEANSVGGMSAGMTTVRLMRGAKKGQ